MQDKNKEGLIEDLKKIKIKRSEKDGKRYLDKKDLTALIKTLKDNGYFDPETMGDPISRSPVEFVRSSGWAALIDASLGTTYTFPDKKLVDGINFQDFGRLFNELNDDTEFSKAMEDSYVASVPARSIFDEDYEDIIEDVLGYGADTIVSRSIIRLSYEEDIFSEMKSKIGEDIQDEKSKISYKTIASLYLSSYPDLLKADSKIHWVFCVYDKDGKDKDGNWSWGLDELGNNSPLGRAYNWLVAYDKKYETNKAGEFVDAMIDLQTICNSQPDLTINYILNSDKKKILDKIKQEQPALIPSKGEVLGKSESTGSIINNKFNEVVSGMCLSEDNLNTVSYKIEINALENKRKSCEIA